jgi:large subunit ribosomal protein L35
MKNKIRSSKSAQKRFRVTGSGKIVYLGAGHSHHMEKKSSSDKPAQLRKRVVKKCDFKNIRLSLPNVKL